MDTAKKRILVVEDDPGIRGAVVSFLDRQGFAVASVGDGEEALLAVDHADVVLLDIFLPKLTGDEFLKRIRAGGNYVPVVLMSAAMRGPEAMECFREFKVVDFLAKPFKMKDLLDKVDRAAAVADDLQTVKGATDRLKGFIKRQAAY